MPESVVATHYAAAAILFSESNTRFVVEVEPDSVDAFKTAMGDVDVQSIGSVVADPKLTIEMANTIFIESDLATLKSAWQGTLDWA